jgi:hypothetical protein
LIGHTHTQRLAIFQSTLEKNDDLRQTGMRTDIFYDRDSDIIYLQAGQRVAYTKYRHKNNAYTLLFDVQNIIINIRLGL